MMCESCSPSLIFSEHTIYSVTIDFAILNDSFYDLNLEFSLTNASILCLVLHAILLILIILHYRFGGIHDSWKLSSHYPRLVTGTRDTQCARHN